MFAITWSAPKHNDGAVTEETVCCEYFEDAQEDLIERLEALGIAEHECSYQITDVENGHVYIAMKMGKCLVRGW